MLNNPQIVHKVKADVDIMNSILNHKSYSGNDDKFFDESICANLIDGSVNIINYTKWDIRDLPQIFGENYINEKKIEKKYNKLKDKWIIHHSTVGIPTFKNIKNLNCFIKNQTYSYALSSFNMMLNWNGYNRVMVGSQQDWFNIKTLKEIRNKSNFLKINSRTITHEKIFNNMILVPNKIDVDNHNIKLFDIYMGNENGSSYTFDHSLFENKIKYKSSATNGKELPVIFVKNNTEEFITIDSGQKLFKVGEFKVVGRTYYDYEKNRTEIGLKKDSQIGELIPFNFSGNFIREIIFKPNSVFGETKIVTEKEISTPILHPFYGKVRMEINNNNKETITNLKVLSQKYVKDIRERFKNTGEIPSLNWYERVSYNDDEIL